MLQTDRDAFHHAHLAWERGDIEAFMAYLHEDIVYLVNVDGMQVPYAMSALGKNDAYERLSFLIHTFVVERFTLEKLVHEVDQSWSVVHGIYRHRKTGEVLETKLRFKGWMSAGKITRLEETLDANYIQAFERFVFYQQQAAGDIA